MLQVGLRAIPGKVQYMIDWQPCVFMIHGGMAAATTATRPLARVNALVLSALEDTAVDQVVWMLAHKFKQAAGQFRCSDGEWITEADIKGNVEADRLAKLAVQQHRVDSAEVTLWERLCKETMDTVKWVARATWAANNCEDAPYRDSEACQWRAAAFKREAKAKRVAQTHAEGDGQGQRPEDGQLDMRGHDLVKVLQLSGIRSGWRCRVCRKISSKKQLLVSRPCTGSPITKWRCIEQDSEDETPATQSQQHKKMLSGAVLWCNRCGVYADQKSKGLKGECKGKPPRHKHRGGMEGQLRKLRKGHPSEDWCLSLACCRA